VYPICVLKMYWVGQLGPSIDVNDEISNMPILGPHINDIRGALQRVLLIMELADHSSHMA
jgi:hypothetical protein